MTQASGDFATNVAANRAEAQRRLAVRRRRRQTLPAVVAGSATLAGLSLSVSWVAARMDAASAKPAPPAATSSAAATTAEADRVAALARRLTDEEQALQSLTARAVSPGPRVTTPAHTTPARTAPRRAPATHATTGASGAG